MIIKNIGNNVINIPESNKVRIIVEGNNNIINVSPDMPLETDIDVQIYGDNNYVEIGPTIGQLRVDIGYNDDRRTRGAKFISGKNRMNGVNTFLLEDNTEIIIGDNNRISSGVNIINTDQHTMLDSNNNVINHAHSIKIGNDCWITKDVTILKNTEIADGCTIGTKSVVAGKFLTPHCVIAGNPAKIIRQNVYPHALRPDFYEQRHPNKNNTVKRQVLFSKIETYKLFGLIKIFTVKTTKNDKTIYIFGLPIFKAKIIK